MSASEKSVVTCSFVSAEPSARGCDERARSPFGVTRRDSFSTPLRPHWRIWGSPLLSRAERRRSKTRSTLLLGIGALPAQLAGQHVAQHREVAAQAVEGMAEGGRPVLLEEEVTDPGKQVSGERDDP